MLFNVVYFFPLSPFLPSPRNSRMLLRKRSVPVFRSSKKRRRKKKKKALIKYLQTRSTLYRLMGKLINNSMFFYDSRLVPFSLSLSLSPWHIHLPLIVSQFYYVDCECFPSNKFTAARQKRESETLLSKD